VFLEVKKSPVPLVTLVGPRKVISDIYQSIRQSLNKRDFNNPLVVCTLSTLGSSMELRLTGFKGVDNTTLMKSSLLQEVLSYGYTLLSPKNVKDNSLTFERLPTFRI
jgi:hypothetical protein